MKTRKWKIFWIRPPSYILALGGLVTIVDGLITVITLGVITTTLQLKMAFWGLKRRKRAQRWVNSGKLSSEQEPAKSIQPDDPDDMFTSHMSF